MAKETSVTAIRQELKKGAARDKWEKLIAQACWRTEGGWTKKRARATNH